MKHRVRTLLIILIDFMMVNISILIAFLLRYDFTFPDKWLKSLSIILIGSSFIKMNIFVFSGIYKSLWRYAGTREFLLIAFYDLAGNAILLELNVCSKLYIPYSVYLIAFIFDVLLISSVRIIYRLSRRMLNGQMILEKGGKRILIFGGGDLGAHVVNELQRQVDLRCKPVVIIDDDEGKQGNKIRGVPIVAGIDSLSYVLEDYKIDEVIIAIAKLDKEVLNQVYSTSNRMHCKVRMIPTISQAINGNFSINKIRELNIEDLLGRETIDVVDENTLNFINNKIVMVTGGGGSIGSELCRQIAQHKPSRLVVLDNYENNAYDLQNEIWRDYPELDVRVVIANIRENASLMKIFDKQRPNIVFHAAAHKHVPLMEDNPLEAIKNNIFGTKNIAEISSIYGVKKFVLISTDKAVNPTNIMGATKRVAEMIIQGINLRSNTEFVAVRFGNVLGSNGSVIPLFQKQIKAGGPVTVTHREVTRFFMTIKEAVQLVIQAGSIGKNGEIMVLDMGRPMKIYDLARKVIELSGFIPDQDIKIKITGLRPGEKLYEELLLTEEGLARTLSNKIHVAKPTAIDYLILRKELCKLEEIIYDSPEKVINFLKYLVPTYKKQPERTMKVDNTKLIKNIIDNGNDEKIKPEKKRFVSGKEVKPGHIYAN